MKRENHDPIDVDLTGFLPDKTYDECLVICRKLKLIEMLHHGEHEYGRMTQRGINVFCTLAQMAGNMTDPKNKLQQS